MKAQFLIVLLLTLFITGCFYSGMNLKEYDLDTASEDQILYVINQNYGKLRSVSGKFDFSYSTPSDKNQSSGYLYISRNDTVYIEINGLVGETEAVLFINKDSVKAVNYFNKILITGQSGENSVKRITGMDITVSQLKNSLLCYEPSEVPFKITGREKDRINFRIELNEKEYQFVTVNKNFLITEVSQYYERELMFKREYDYFSSDNGYIMPKRIRFRTFNPPTKLTLFYTKMDINENPAGFAEVSL
ncbi:MAG TPA: lipoprotein insertase outer membrane protein LolB [Clostridiales bacterium]|jgi:outer membrane biogenesis lipoprotein LolB|nr:lipoprotein insertase outer membrane protein LolB [Clostridiales bacterium]HQP68829.1 lipoprotein insertase outer membrane protein LolB [Clostridiales bacterium]